MSGSSGTDRQQHGNIRTVLEVVVALAFGGILSVAGFVANNRIEGLKDHIAELNQDIGKLTKENERLKDQKRTEEPSADLREKLSACQRKLGTRCPPRPPGGDKCTRKLEKCKQALKDSEKCYLCDGTIHCGQTVSGTISEPTVSCKYSFSLDSSATVRVKMARTLKSQKIRPHFSVRDSRGREILESGQRGDGIFGEEQAEANLMAGHYQILADGHDNSVGDFNLTIVCFSHE